MSMSKFEATNLIVPIHDNTCQSFVGYYRRRPNVAKILADVVKSGNLVILVTEISTLVSPPENFYVKNLVARAVVVVKWSACSRLLLRRSECESR